MRTLAVDRYWRRGSAFVAAAGFAALVLFSSAALAQCVNLEDGGVVAPAGQTCVVSGNYATSGDNEIAGQATGLNALITGPSEGTVSFMTSGANANALQADSGGHITLTAGTVNATGDGSYGLFIEGTGSALQASGVAVSTSGNSVPDANNWSHGLEVYDGATATFSGGSITTSGTSALGVAAGTTGPTTSVTISNGAAILTNGAGSSGIAVNGSNATVTADGISITTHGGIDTSDDFYADGAYNGGASWTPNGGVLNLTNVSITTTGYGASGVVTGNAGTTNISGGSIAISGDSANGVLTQSGGSTTVNGGSIDTTGNAAYAVTANSGGFATLNGTTIGTTGNGSGGLGINGAGSEIDATNVTVTTTGAYDTASGQHSYGVYNGPYGTFPAGGVAKLTDTSVATEGVQMFGVFTGAGGSTTILGGSIATAGSLANAVQTNNGGRLTIGLDGSGTATTISTTGASAAGVVAYNGGVVELTGATISTTGAGSTGLGVNGSGSSLTASGVTVTTQGGVDSSTGDHADGAYNGPYGALTSGGVLSLANSKISTSGPTADGVATDAGGATTLTGGSIKTTGLESPGVNAYGGGGVTLSGMSIATTGNGSKGIEVLGTGSSVSASGVTVSTEGTIISADGDHAYAVYNGASPGTSYTTGGTVTLSNVTAQTTGVASSAIVTADGGVTNLSGVSVLTTGQDAFALSVSGSGSQANLSGSNTFTTQGAGAIGVVASLGGVINATGPISVTTSGGVSPATGFGANGVVADGAGAKVNLATATITTSGPGAYALVASDSTASGSAGAITASGVLNIKTTNASDVGVLLQGNGASVVAAGGGAITTAGNAIDFTSGTGQTATFDKFNIANQSGDLIFADPSVATINFNATTANAGTNNLLDATAGSVVTLNANASNLTGAIRTDSTSTSNVNLTNGTTWTLTGPSTITNLAVTNSIVVFAPPGSGGGFKTLTVTNYSGSGANITMNVALGGPTSSADQIIINGGRATGTTLLTIRNVGGLGGQTTGSGIPLVIATNGGSIASNAFALASTPIVGGFKYTLNESSDEWFLVSQPTSTVAEITNSITNVAKAQQTQMITNRVLSSILLGATEQVSCSSCGSGFASIGSFAAGAHGRWGLSDELTLMGGFSYNQWNASGITVENAPTIAGSLVYDFWKWGPSRPFLEAGGALTPYEDVHYSRSYANGLTTSVGTASAINRDLSLFARAGWVARLSPTDEAAIYGDLSRNWMQTGGYTEASSALNPYPATVSNGLDLLNVAHVGAQITHLFNGNIEANLSGAVAYGFGAGAGAAVNVYDFGPIAPNALPNTTWVEYGARLGYRYSDRLVIDAFVVGTAFGAVGTTLHGGIGLRYSF